MQRNAQIFPSKKEGKAQELAEEESRTLFKAKSLFPFSLFPDQIIIHPTKVDIIIGEFFKSSYTKTFFIEDIGGIEIVTTPFMAGIKISGNKMGVDPIVVPNFKRKDAIKIKELIDGLLISHKHKNELKDIKSDKSIPHLQKAGEFQGKNSRE